MAQPFVPGPAPVWLGFFEQGTEGLVVFLGYSERGVSIDVNPEYSSLVTDAGGNVPTDLIFQGSSATVSASFTRWNEATYVMIADHAARNNPQRQALGGGIGLKRGAEPRGRVGTIMALEGAAFCLFVAFPNAIRLGVAAVKPGALPNPYVTMPAGYRFPFAVLDRDGLPERGSKPARLSLNFRCFRSIPREVLASATSYPPEDGQDLYVLYDHAMGLLAGKLPD